jgi:hypothetical protein
MLYLSHKFKSFSPSFPPKAYKQLSEIQKIDAKNARFDNISGFSINFSYLLKRVTLLLKLSFASLPPKINIPRPFGKCTIVLKNRN